jgi:hypothetical protein
MKTPRELLLARHQSAEPALDRLTREVVRAMAPPTEAEPHRAPRWADWLWPSPAAWGAVAAAWLVVVGFNLASTPPRPERPALARQSPEILQALREQRQLFVELIAPAVRDPEPARPKRRSEYVQPVIMA